ncbi:hypothetical protein LAZ67_23001440 [Cordylochernes scorpioides]|uniref:Uncharacterized protein n=1 Tax=Cordylochernes scorpioides TaxID=51811 RepID=A0ABY6LQR7_9ARAC|nr:hypothetical protein LAZ67_23001440 [Cordylochernes scorpioides]
MDETETELGVGASSRVLGILWDNSRDAFRININNPGEGLLELSIGTCIIIEGILEMRIRTFTIMAESLGNEKLDYYHHDRGSWNLDSGLLTSWQGLLELRNWTIIIMTGALGT